MAEVSPQALAQQLAYMQNPQQGLQLQQQQALANMMMQEGAQQPDPNAMVSGHVVATNPWASLAKAGERLAGAYEQKDANQKLATMMQGTQGGMGSLNGAAPLTGNIMQDAMMANTNPEGYKAAVALKNAGPTKEAEQRKTIVDVNGHKQLGDTFFPSTPNTQVSNVAQPTSSPPEGGDKDFLTQLVPDSNAPSAVNIQQPTGQNVDWNNPAQAKQADSQAEKTGENAADVGKTLNVMQSNLPMVLQRFDKMRGAAKDASYGAGTTAGEDGSPPAMVTLHDMLKDKTAVANGIIQQTSAQGVLPELGPTLAQAGIKGNKFLETLSSNASAIPLHQAPEVKLNTINGLESQYINNLKSTSAQARALGQKAPSDSDIDAIIANIKSQSQSQPDTKVIGGVTYTKINGQWHQ